MHTAFGIALALASIQAQAAAQSAGLHPILLTLIFIGMLVVLVLVHELGHFLTALRMGISVEEFGIGLPPRAATLFRHNGVAYTLNWLPLGGFVRFGGEDNAVYGAGSLSEASPWRKIPVMFAGPFANFLTAVLIFSIMAGTAGLVLPTGKGQQIGQVFPDTPAAEAGFEEGDVVLRLADEPVTDLNAIRDIASDYKGESIEAVVERGDEQLTLTVTPGPWSSQGIESEVGLGFRYGPDVELTQTSNPFLALWAGLMHTFSVLVVMLNGLGQLIGGLIGLTEAPAGGVAGPVGIARATGEVIETNGIIGFWNWMAIISLNLFVLNLLPIPALDGSHIVFSLIELLRGGKKVPPEKEALVHAIGFAALMGLIVLVSAIDIINAINGEPVIR
jgi:regulator of sigma E protease